MLMKLPFSTEYVKSVPGFSAPKVYSTVPVESSALTLAEDAVKYCPLLLKLYPAL